MDERNAPGTGSGPAAVPGLVSGGGAGPMSERMQALLSRAAEEQLSEQRQVSTVLGELRGLVAGLSEQLRGTAQASRLDGLADDVGTLATELRRSTAGLGERLDVLARRVDEQASSVVEQATTSGAGTEALAVRVTTLSSDVAAQADALEQVLGELRALAAFPDALAALQRDISGVHDRLSPLGEVRSSLVDVVGRTTDLEGLRPEIAALAHRLDGTATTADLDRVRESLGGDLTGRLDRLEQAASRASVTPDDLREQLAAVHSRLDELAAGGPAVERVSALEERLGTVEQRLGTVVDLVSNVRDRSEGLPGMTAGLARLQERLEELPQLRSDVAALQEGVTAVREDSAVPSVVLGLTALREDLEELSGRVGEVSVPSPEQVAGAVSSELTDRLLEQLAPRVADLVFARVADTLVERVTDNVSARVQTGLSERVRAATVDSERRISAHVDEAVLALAEALLRRRRGGRPVAGSPAGLDEATMAIDMNAVNAAAAATAAGAGAAPAAADGPTTPGGVAQGDGDAAQDSGDAAPAGDRAGEARPDEVLADEVLAAEDAAGDGTGASATGAAGTASAEAEGPAGTGSDEQTAPAAQDAAGEDAGGAAAAGLADVPAPPVDARDLAPDAAASDAAGDDATAEGSATEDAAADAGPEDAGTGPADDDEDGGEDEEIVPRAFSLRRTDEPLVEPTPDMDEDDRDPVTTEPRSGRPAPPATPLIDVQRGALRSPRSDPDEDDDAGARRPWWRPGG